MNESPDSTSDRKTSRVTIGDIDEGIRGSNIAGRDVIQRITQILTGDTSQQHHLRNRDAMLKLVKAFWVKGVLESSLHGAVLIELGMEARQDAVEHPWDMILQAPGQSTRPLQPGASIVDVFDETGPDILILGEPGSGKTTMLLELARETIARAEHDAMRPIPVVFNLSSWAEQRRALSEWLVEELRSKYNVPLKVAQPWIDNDELLLLLDGLDEVASEHRESCVKEINNFRQEHLVPMVVCCRFGDYEALRLRLKFQSAVILQPLSSQQIEAYLSGAGSELEAARRAFQEDASVRELAQSPLMLSIMTLAYKGQSTQDFGPVESIEARRRHLFDAYIQNMFKRRGSHQHFSSEQTLFWLTSLARKMSQDGQIVFLVEQMQPNWLDTFKEKMMYAACSRLAMGLISALFGGWLCLIFLQLIVLTISFLDSITVDSVPSLIELASSSIILWLIGLLVVAFLLGPIGAVSGFIIGVFKFKKFATDKINVVESLEWSWAEVKNKLSIAVDILEQESNRVTLHYWDNSISYLKFCIKFAASFSHGLTAIVKEEQISLSKNIRRLIKYAMIGGAFNVLFGILFVFIVWVLIIILGLPSAVLQFLKEIKNTDNILLLLLSPVLIALIIGIALGIILGPIGLLRYGCRAFIQHCTLRLILWQRGFIPLKYEGFLDYATNRIFLRKVGKGYIFIHRLLQEHFANLDIEHAEALRKIILAHKIRTTLVNAVILCQLGMATLAALFALLAFLRWSDDFAIFSIDNLLVLPATLGFVVPVGLRKRRLWAYILSLVLVGLIPFIFLFTLAALLQFVVVPISLCCLIFLLHPQVRGNFGAHTIKGRR